MVVQSQWLVSVDKGRPMHGQAEFIGGLWNSARIVPSSLGSLSSGMILHC